MFFRLRVFFFELKALEELFIHEKEVRGWGNVANLGKVKGLFEIFVFIFLKMGPGEIKEVTLERVWSLDRA